MTLLKLFVQKNCPKCPTAKKILKQLLKKRKDLTLETLDLANEENVYSLLMLQVMSTPTLTLGEQIIFIGDPPSLDELEQKIDTIIHNYPHLTDNKFVAESLDKWLS